MITFKTLTIRNFLSYGNSITTIKLDFSKPTLITGKNYDSVVNGQVDSNGSGKSAILNAISYCMYDKTISDIEKSDIVNYTNGKNMEVSIVFKKDTTYYKIERYRKNKAKGGDGVRIFINEKEEKFLPEHDKTPDSVANANKEIERIIGLPFDIFARIVVFRASYEPFLSLPSSHATKANQRDIIEELFGLTELSRKAETLKGIIADTKKQLQAIIEKNERIKSENARYEQQLNSTIVKASEWNQDKKNQLQELKKKLKLLATIEIAEIEHIVEKINALTAEKTAILSDIKLEEKYFDMACRNNNSLESWEIKKQKTIEDLRTKIKALKQIDTKYFTEVKEKINSLNNELAEVEAEIKQNKKTLNALKSNKDDTEEELNSLMHQICPYCKQEYHASTDSKQECMDKLKQLSVDIDSINNCLNSLEDRRNILERELTPLLDIEIPYNLKSIESDILIAENELNNHMQSVNPFEKMDSFKHESKLLDLRDTLVQIDFSINQLYEQLKEYDGSVLGITEWNRSAINMVNSSIDKISDSIHRLKTSVNPFLSIVSELQYTIENELEKVDTDLVDTLSNKLEHQEFLLKLLTKKDSFVRKALLNKNIPFLNSRLSHYLETIGLNHKVLFTEEMGVKITQFGTEYSFKNLSDGQKARVNLALSFAFRDVLQARFSKINFCILDECLDVGLGNVGIQLAAKMIKSIATTEKLSLFVISHRDEISNMFESKLEIELKDGFSKVCNGEESGTKEI